MKRWRAFVPASSRAPPSFNLDSMNPLPRTKGGESQAHRELKRLALMWAQANGFRVAAAEVSLPHRRVRMDVAAYQPQRVREARRDERTQRERLVWKTTIGVTAIFECKASAADFIRDARLMKATLEQLKALQEKRERAEQELKIFYPSIRNGDSLFQEYETLNFERPGYERYEKIMREIRRHSDRLHGNTKFDRLAKYGAANLFYVVAEPAAISSHVLPCGWGLLERVGDGLTLKLKPLWHEVPVEDRLAFFQRVAMAATRSVHREHGAVFVPEDDARYATARDHSPPLTTSARVARSP
jgi:hypothetical protein